MGKDARPFQCSAAQLLLWFSCRSLLLWKLAVQYACHVRRDSTSTKRAYCAEDGVTLSVIPNENVCARCLPHKVWSPLLETLPNFAVSLSSLSIHHDVPSNKWSPKGRRLSLSTANLAQTLNLPLARTLSSSFIGDRRDEEQACRCTI